MTEERKIEVLDFGWEVMKYQGAPTIALWLAEDDWEGVTISATRPKGVEAPNVLVKLNVWDRLFILAEHNPN